MSPIARGTLAALTGALLAWGLIVLAVQAHRATADPEPWPAPAVTR